MKENKNTLREISDQITEISLAVERMRAVAVSFANEYIDIPDEQLETAAALDPDHYRCLFYAALAMLDDIGRKADAADLAVFNLHRAG